MQDFSELLKEMVVNGTYSEAETIAPERINKRMQAGRPTKRTLMVDFNQLHRLTEEAVGDFDKHMQDITTVLQPLLNEIKKKIGGVSATFSGLKNLSQEQQEHIAEVIKSANERVNSLKKTAQEAQHLAAKLQQHIDTQDAELKDKGSVSQRNSELQARVTELEGQITAKTREYEKALHKKEMELENREQDFDEVLDAYEKVMFKMKRSEMNARRKIEELEEELNKEFNYEHAHFKPAGPKITEKANNYGDFDLNEHLRKIKEAPRSQYDW